MPGLEQKDYLTDDELSALESSEPTPKPTPDTTPDYLSDEQMEALTRADKAAAAQAGLQEKYQSYIAPIMSFFEAPAKVVQRSLQMAADIATGEFGKVWERAKTGAEATPMREVLPKIGISGKETIPTPFKDIQMRTIKTSPANLVATGLNFGSDPLNWPIPGGGKGFFAPAGSKPGGAIISKSPNIAGKVYGGATEATLKTFGHISNEDLKYLLENRYRLKGKTSGGEVAKETMIAETSRALEPIEARAAHYDEMAKKAVDDAKRLWEEEKRRLRDPIQDTTEQNRILAAMQNIKDQLVADSIKADEALAKSGRMYRRGDLIDLVRDIASEGIGKDVISPQAQNAAARMVDLVERLGGSPQEPAGFGRKRAAKIADEMLDAPRVRDILKQVREATHFDQGAGAFDERLDRMNKRFSKAVSDTLKLDVPEYKAYMDKMSGMARVLEEMRSFVGGANPTAEQMRATRMLEKLRKGGADAESVEALLRRLAEESGDDELLAAIEELNLRSQQRRQMEGKTFEYDFGRFFPEQEKHLFDAKIAADLAKLKKKEVLGQKIPSIYTQLSEQRKNKTAARAQAEAIKRETGIDVEEQARDWGVLERLEKPRRAGAKWAALGGLVGGAVGAKTGDNPLISGALSGAAGFYGEQYAGQLAKRAIDAGTSARLAAASARGAARKIFDKVTLGAFANTKFGPVLQKLAEGGPSAFSVYHHVMYNNDPEYRKLVDDSLKGVE